MHDRFIADTPKSYKTYDIFDLKKNLSTPVLRGYIIKISYSQNMFKTDMIRNFRFFYVVVTIYYWWWVLYIGDDIDIAEASEYNESVKLGSALWEMGKL